MTEPGSNYDTGWLASVSFDASGLICAIAQDAVSRRILMVAWMNRAALQETVASGRAVYFSRSRRRLWRKGEESGNTQRVKSIRLDCDGDAVLLEIEQVGGIACHTGRESCFYQELKDGRWLETDQPIKSPEELYGPSK
ncbi:MAG: phosphoribosyl-AMP cyclohydrolase [Burkholderiaceae bacterium]